MGCLGFLQAAGSGGDEGGGFVLVVCSLGIAFFPGQRLFFLNRLFCRIRCWPLAIKLLSYLFHLRDHALEGFQYLFRLIITLLLEAEFEDVSSGPEHAEGGVAAFVGCVHGADSLIGLLYASLLTQVENFFDGHGSN